MHSFSSTQSSSPSSSASVTPTKSQWVPICSQRPQPEFALYSPFNSPLSIDSASTNAPLSSIWSPLSQQSFSASLCQSPRPLIRKIADAETWSQNPIGHEVKSPKLPTKQHVQAAPKRSDHFDFTYMIYQAKIKQTKSGKRVFCSFCRNNDEEELVYTSHQLKDSLGRVTCPILKAHSCPICGATGDLSHTLKYCPILQKKSKLQKILRHVNLD